ncbi:SRPBCC family protein [Microbacterium hominis]|uniref:SRPBCC domain-containing protein n=1 Tax=Microbacterium hominis TaxID=162426 RepID=A0A7D4U851_9MICO|nr:SRPBCC domain-containing protein [Microbacterium hominis]QKJ19706.1 SRPBCC domain-containing protein [Microbacterium hominis]
MLELIEEALVDAPIEVVWNDLTDPIALAAWFWPERMQTEARIDLRVEGAYEVRSGPASLAVAGVIVALEAPRMLRLQWRWEGEEHATDVEIGLEPAADDSTRLRVAHAGFLTADERASHVEGWSGCLQRLIDRHAAWVGGA